MGSRRTWAKASPLPRTPRPRCHCVKRIKTRAFFLTFYLSAQASSKTGRGVWRWRQASPYSQNPEFQNLWVTKTSYNIQGGFFNWSALKMTKCQTLRKFWHLELFWRDLHVIWHLVIFWADQLKKPPCSWVWYEIELVLDLRTCLHCVLLFPLPWPLIRLRNMGQ